MTYKKAEGSRNKFDSRKLATVSVSLRKCETPIGGTGQRYFFYGHFAPTGCDPSPTIQKQRPQLQTHVLRVPAASAEGGLLSGHAFEGPALQDVALPL